MKITNLIKMIQYCITSNKLHISIIAKTIVDRRITKNDELIGKIDGVTEPERDDDPQNYNEEICW
jgi:hypothetical protein